MQLYMNDQKNGRFPGPVYRNQKSSATAGDAHLTSPKLLQPYLGNHIVERDGTKYFTIFECPAWKKVIGDESQLANFCSYYTNDKAEKNDGSTGDVLGYAGGSPKTEPWTMQDLAAPSQTFVLVDLDSTTKGKTESYTITERAHGNVWNYLFADGHVAASKIKLKK